MTIVPMLEGSVMMRVRQLRGRQNAEWKRYFEMEERFADAMHQAAHWQREMDLSQNKIARFKKRIEDLGESDENES